jgi:hypothetical protein
MVELDSLAENPCRVVVVLTTHDRAQIDQGVISLHRFPLVSPGLVRFHLINANCVDIEAAYKVP